MSQYKVPLELSIEPQSGALPAYVLDYKPTHADIIQQFAKDSERKVHSYVDLTAEEQKQAEQFIELAAKQKVELDAYWTARITRYVSRTRGKVPAALDLMKTGIEWRRENVTQRKQGVITDKEILSDLKLGIVYFGGRDKACRPQLVVRPDRIPTSWFSEKGSAERLLNLIIFTMEFLQHYMLVPGIVESIIVTIDLNGLSTSQIPVAALKKVASVLSKHYMGRVFKMFIVDAPSFVNGIWWMCKGLLTDRQQAKIAFISSSSAGELTALFDPEKLEQRYGGKRAAVQGPFYPFPFVPDDATERRALPAELLAGGKLRVGKDKATSPPAYIRLADRGRETDEEYGDMEDLKPPQKGAKTVQDAPTGEKANGAANGEKANGAANGEKANGANGEAHKGTDSAEAPENAGQRTQDDATESQDALSGGVKPLMPLPQEEETLSGEPDLIDERVEPQLVQSNSWFGFTCCAVCVRGA